MDSSQQEHKLISTGPQSEAHSSYFPQSPLYPTELPVPPTIPRAPTLANLAHPHPAESRQQSSTPCCPEANKSYGLGAPMSPVGTLSYELLKALRDHQLQIDSQESLSMEQAA